MSPTLAQASGEPYRADCLTARTRSVGEALLGVRGVLLAGLLGPEAFGIWALFRMVLTYGNFAGLGLSGGSSWRWRDAGADRDGARRIPWGRTAVGCELVCSAVSPFWP